LKSQPSIFALEVGATCEESDCGYLTFTIEYESVKEKPTCRLRRTALRIM
jgi:hypothetical protein